mgnify:CR=1 FL=1
MERITKAHLDRVVTLLNRLVPGEDYSIGYAYGGVKLESHQESWDVSPRLSKGELYQWMQAYRQGIEVAQDHNRKLSA